MQREITGVMIYYYKVCLRKLWYFYHEINMEQENENNMKGIIYHEYGLYTGFTRAPDYGRPYSTGVATCKNPARDIADRR